MGGELRRKRPRQQNKPNQHPVHVLFDAPSLIMDAMGFRLRSVTWLAAGAVPWAPGTTPLTAPVSLRPDVAPASRSSQSEVEAIWDGAGSPRVHRGVSRSCGLSWRRACNSLRRSSVLSFYRQDEIG